MIENKGKIALKIVTITKNRGRKENLSKFWF